jgi:hypothetical protein
LGLCVRQSLIEAGVFLVLRFFQSAIVFEGVSTGLRFGSAGYLFEAFAMGEGVAVPHGQCVVAAVGEEFVEWVGGYVAVGEKDHEAVLVAGSHAFVAVGVFGGFAAAGEDAHAVFVSCGPAADAVAHGDQVGGDGYGGFGYGANDVAADGGHAGEAEWFGFGAAAEAVGVVAVAGDFATAVVFGLCCASAAAQT